MLSFLREFFRGVSSIAKYSPCNIHNPKSMHRCFNASLTPHDRGITTTTDSIILVISNLKWSSIWYIFTRIYSCNIKTTCLWFSISLNHVTLLRSAKIKGKRILKKEKNEEERKKRKERLRQSYRREERTSPFKRSERFRAFLSGGGDAVGPTGSPGGPSVSFGALVARPRVYRIEDLRRFSESFVHPRTSSRGFSRALDTTAQYTAWQPGPREAYSLHRRRMERVDAVLACIRERTRKHARSFERAPFCVFWNAHTASASSAHMVPISIPDHVWDRIFARGDPISSTSVAQARHATAQSRSAEKGSWSASRSMRATSSLADWSLLQDRAWRPETAMVPEKTRRHDNRHVCHP